MVSAVFIPFDNLLFTLFIGYENNGFASIQYHRELIFCRTYLLLSRWDNSLGIGQIPATVKFIVFHIGLFIGKVHKRIR